VVGKHTSQPESELTQLITDIVDRILKNRRFHPQPPQAALTKRQCATSAGVGLSTIESAIREGDLEARKIGKRTMLRRPHSGVGWNPDRASSPRTPMRNLFAALVVRSISAAVPSELQV
jgi:hypothetical protein